MIRIGDFARMGEVTVQTLRHYDKLGLLVPAHTDADNGYRYYDKEQLNVLRKVLILSDMGLSLEQIKIMFYDRLTQEELNAMLLIKQAELQQQKEIVENGLKMVDQ
jgi:DNA-binding transcriptional MerR regulator